MTDRGGGGAPPQRIAGRYRLETRIGQGASGIVYRAIDLELERTVALKLLHLRWDGDEEAAQEEAGPSEAPLDGERARAGEDARPAPDPVADGRWAAPPSGSADGADEASSASDEEDTHLGLVERARRRFRQEARAAAKLRHEGIVRLLDSGVDQGRPYLVMELIDGVTLGELCRRGGEREACIRAVAEAAEAVAHAHAQGVLHRDLKPANVLIDRAGRARVADFGLALDRSRETRITRTGELLGTPAYLAPESARGQVPDERTDVYGLGAMLYEVLCGRPPFTGRAAWQVLRAVLDDDPESPRSIDPGVPWDLEAVVLRALDKHPALRYPSASEFAAELRRYLSGEPVLARRPGVFAHTRLRSFFRRNRRLSIGIAAAAVFGLGLLAREPGLEVGRVRRARAEEALARASAASSTEEEIQLIRDALRIDDDYPRAHLELGNAYARRAISAARRGEGRLREASYASALQSLERAARSARRPIAALAWCRRGQLVEDLGPDPAKARDDYARAAGFLGLDTPPVLFARARLHQLDGELPEARSLFDELLRDDAYFAIGFVHRSEVRLAQGDLEGALADAVRALELTPESPAAHLARASARELSGDAPGASRDRAVASSLRPPPNDAPRLEAAPGP